MLFGACLFTELKTYYSLSFQPGTGCIIYKLPDFSWIGLTLKRWPKRQKLTQACENLLFYTREGEKLPNILESNVDFSPSDVYFYAMMSKYFKKLFALCFQWTEVGLTENIISQIRSNFVEFKIQYISASMLDVKKSKCDTVGKYINENINGRNY